MKKILVWVLLPATFLTIVLLDSLIIPFYINYLWFEQLGYLNLYLIPLFTNIKLFFIFGVLFFIFVYTNSVIALLFSPRRIYIIEHGRRDLSYLIAALVTLILAALFASNASLYTYDYLLFKNSTKFGITDPLYNKDISFYVFKLPFLKYIYSFSIWTIIITLIVILGCYLLSQPKEFFLHNLVTLKTIRLPKQIIIQLCILLSILFLLIAIGCHLKTYSLLYSPHGVVFGATYTDVKAELPLLNLLFILSILTAAAFLVTIFLKNIKLPAIFVILLIIITLIGYGIYQPIIQHFVVSPNELDKEKEFIKHNIKYTRLAYNLNKIKEKDFPASPTLTTEKINKNKETIENVRLWDERAIKATLKQLQEIRTYYEFTLPDVDRYNIGGSYKQVLLSARELNVDELPTKAQTFVNRYLKFTHGYGVVMTSVREVTEEGSPIFIIKDIPPKSKFFKIDIPQIYFGEKTDNFVVVNTKTDEFDYPKGDKNIYTQYKAETGIQINSIIRKLALAIHQKNIKLLFSGYITKNSRILLYRNINERVRKIAPFLLYDNDPYLVVTNDRLYWLYDAYTYTNVYPYSKPYKNLLNYIRNSVKIVIDAYTGEVKFYLIDKDDPIIKVYSTIFKDVFLPFTEMPEELKKHIRYPKDLFTIQAELYTLYHMQTEEVFYNKEDLWEIPKEIFEVEQLMEPYYLIMRLPNEKKEEYILMLPFTPTKRNNMIAHLVARCDLPHYGEVIIYKLPKDKLIYGPMQIEARIDQDEEISELFTLWGQRGSRVIRGHLLVIPIEDSLLYVEPIYLIAEEQAIPEMKRVVVATAEKLSMKENIHDALVDVIGVKKVEKEKIVKPVLPEVKKEKIKEELLKEAISHFEKALEILKKMIE